MVEDAVSRAWLRYMVFFLLHRIPLSLSAKARAARFLKQHGRPIPPWPVPILLCLSILIALADSALAGTDIEETHHYPLDTGPAPATPPRSSSSFISSPLWSLEFLDTRPSSLFCSALLCSALLCSALLCPVVFVKQTKAHDTPRIRFFPLNCSQPRTLPFASPQRGKTRE
jgi:hypothetical protein